jgi:hypothetical protein
VFRIQGGRVGCQPRLGGAHVLMRGSWGAVRRNAVASRNGLQTAGQRYPPLRGGSIARHDRRSIPQKGEDADRSLLRGARPIRPLDDSGSWLDWLMRQRCDAAATSAARGGSASDRGTSPVLTNAEHRSPAL